MGLFSGVEKNTGSLETKKFHSDYGQLLVDGEIITVFREGYYS